MKARRMDFSQQFAELVLDLENQDGLVPLMDLLALRE